MSSVGVPVLLLLSLALPLAGGTGCRRGKSSETAPAAKKNENGRDQTPDPAALVWAKARALPDNATRETPPGRRVGGVLRVHLESEPPSLHPLQDENLATLQVTDRLIYEPLVDCVGPHGEPRPLLATDWQTSPDGLALSLSLRAGARWHDGRPLLPADVQASIEPLLRSNTRARNLHALLTDVEAIEIRPDRSIRLRLVRPSGLVLRALCEIPIMPAALLNGTGPDRNALGRQPVGTGPFRLVGWERGRRIRLVRHGAYWGPSAALDEIHFEIEPDGARALTRTKRGEIDILPRVLDVHFPDQLERLSEKLDIVHLTPARFSFLILNTANDPLSDLRFRQALSILWDRKRMSRDMRHGLARPIAAMPFAPDAESVRFDRAEAERLLDQAGYRDGNADGVREHNGNDFRLRFVYPANAKLAAREGQQFAVELRRAGLLLDLQPVDTQTFMARLQEGNFDLAPATWAGQRDEDPRLLWSGQGAFHFSRYRSPQLSALMDEMVRAPDAGARARIGDRLAGILATQVPVIFLYRHDVLALVSQRVQGLCGPGDRFDLRQVWLQ